MPDVGGINLQITGTYAQLQTALNQAETKVKEFAGEVDTQFAGMEAAASSLNKAWVGLGALLVGGGILAGLKAIDNQVSRMKTSINEAANSMKNLGGSLNTAGIENFIRQLAEGSAAGVASLTELYDGVQILGERVRTTGQLERAMADAVQLAARNHLDFNTAVGYVGKALSGNNTVLVRAGILTRDEAKALRETVPEAHQVEATMELLEKKTRNATDAIDEHTKGWGRVTTAWQLAVAEIGNALAPAITWLIGKNGLLGVALMVDQLAYAMPRAWAAIAKGAKDAFGDLITWFRSMFVPYLLDLGELLVGVLSGNRGLIEDAAGKLKSAWVGALNEITRAFGAAAADWKAYHDDVVAHWNQINSGAGPTPSTPFGAAYPGGTGSGGPKVRKTKAGIPEFNVGNVGTINPSVSIPSGGPGLASILHNVEFVQNVSAAARETSNFARAMRTAVDVVLGRLGKEFEKLHSSVQMGGAGLTTFAALIFMIVQRTKALQDILAIVGNILQVFASILDAILLPVVMTLNRVLTFLVNIVIDVWNVFATLLNALGIHVYYLKHINSLLGNLSATVRPLLDIIHDLPNTKEYKSGTFGALQTDQYAQATQQWQNQLLTTTKQQKDVLLQVLAGLGLLYGVLLVIQALTAIKTAIPFLCPSVDQEIETRDRGMVKAGTLVVGDYLRDPDLKGIWNRVNAVRILPTVVWKFTTEVESISVNQDHAVMDAAGKWVAVRTLRPGDKIERYPEGELTIQSVECMGEGLFASINCDRQRYVLGTSVGHNDSAGIGAFIQHNVAAANRVSALASGFRPPSTGVSTTLSHDNSQTITQTVNIGTVEQVANLADIRDNLSFDAERLSRTRAYTAGRFSS